MKVKVRAGQLFREALQKENPLQIIGVLNAYCALLAVKVGFQALYVSGGGVAYGSHGLPDLGITNLSDVLEDVRRITAVTEVPLLVDVDTGWGDVFGIARTVKSLVQAGAAGLHIEDQVSAKRCGHRPGKSLVSAEEMGDRIKAAVDGRDDDSFVIMARTDAFDTEGLNNAIDRAQRYVELGADMIFAESVATLKDYQQICKTLQVPVLANITEFGKTPLFTVEELRSVGIRMVLYPLSAFRAMSKAALMTYSAIREQGTQKAVLDQMQTREELYKYLNYYAYEQQIDKLFGKE